MQMLPDATALAERAAEVIAEHARDAVAARGEFHLALSGGSTPRAMLAALVDRDDMPWRATDVFQVDERVAPDGHADRNTTMFDEVLWAHVRPGSFTPMPVTDDDLDAAAENYSAAIADVCGQPPEFDLVHLGLGTDGHTASLVPGDAVLGVADATVALTSEYQGRRRMTLTFPVLGAARALLWVVAGAEKHAVLQQLLLGDESIPAGRLSNEHATVLADDAAMLA